MFRKWATFEEVRYPHLEISTFDSIRGMAATTPLVSNAPVMSVPAAIVLQTSTLDVGRSPLKGQVSDGSWKKMPWYARLALKLHLKKKSSEWQSWIRMLPPKFDNPFHWSDSDIAELQNPKLAKAVHQQREIYHVLYCELSGNSNRICDTMTYDDFVWAVECVRSRAFAGPQEVAPFKDRFQLVLFAALNTFAWPSLHLLDWDKALNGGLTAILALVMYDLLFPKILQNVQNVELRRYALAPGIDFLNHTSDVAAAASVAYEYFLDRFVVRAQTDYAAGEQVLISYGKQSSDSLLQYYGFVDEGNEADEFVFGEVAERLMKVSPGTLRVTRDGFAEGTMKEISKGLDGGEKEIGGVLSELCRLELEGFKTTLEEDEELLRASDLTKERELAIKYRMGKKKILLKASQLYDA